MPAVPLTAYHIGQVAEILGITPKGVIGLCNRGKLESRREGLDNHRIIDRAEVSRLIAGGSYPGAEGRMVEMDEWNFK